jgi:hypothetical protein
MVFDRSIAFQKQDSHKPKPTTRFAVRPLVYPVQLMPQRQPTSEDVENEAFQRDKFEAQKLALKQGFGTLTAAEQERLGTLQAGMASFWAQRIERAERFGHDFSKIPVNPPGEHLAPQQQPRLRLETSGVTPNVQLPPPIRWSPPRAAGSMVQRRVVPTGEENTLETIVPPEKLGNASPMAETQRVNHTGLPDNLKAGIENLSGLAMDDVRVHYNSDKPAQLNALAYTQGTEIHVAPGQEQHVPHEAWHVVQQKQGRVSPTLQGRGTAINDDAELEKEADFKGVKASHAGREITQGIPSYTPSFNNEKVHARFSNFEYLAKDIAGSTPQEKKILSPPELKGAMAVDRSPLVDSKTCIQRMPLEKFRQLRAERFKDWETEMRFSDYFIKEYFEWERKGAFLTDGVMYGWNWREYVKDKAFDEKLLEFYFKDFEDIEETGDGGIDTEAVLHYKAMKKMIGEPLEWGIGYMGGPKSMEMEKPFYQWLSNDQAPFPSRCNCWEAVLLAAFRAGIVDKGYIRRAVKRDKGVTGLVKAILENPEGSVQGNGFELLIIKTAIPKGHVILFDKWGEHVALSTGKGRKIESEEIRNRLQMTYGHGILELDADTPGVTASTLEDVQAKKAAYRRQISWGKLPDL